MNIFVNILTKYVVLCEKNDFLELSSIKKTFPSEGGHFPQKEDRATLYSVVWGPALQCITVHYSGALQCGNLPYSAVQCNSG